MQSRLEYLLNPDLLDRVESYLELVSTRDLCIRMVSALRMISCDEVLRMVHAFFLVKLNSLQCDPARIDPPRLDSWGPLLVLGQSLRVGFSVEDCLLFDSIGFRLPTLLTQYCYFDFLALYGISIRLDMPIDESRFPHAFEVVLTPTQCMSWIFSSANAISFLGGGREAELRTGTTSVDPVTFELSRYHGSKSTRPCLQEARSYVDPFSIHTYRSQLDPTIVSMRLSECLSYDMCRFTVVSCPSAELYSAVFLDLTYLGLMDLMFFDHIGGLASMEDYFEHYRALNEIVHKPSIREPDIPAVPYTIHRMDGRAINSHDNRHSIAKLAFSIDYMNPRIFLFSRLFRCKKDICSSAHLWRTYLVPTHGFSDLISKGHGLGTPRTILLHNTYFMIRMPLNAYMVQIIGTVFPRATCPTPLLRQCGILEKVSFLQNPRWFGIHRYFDATAVQCSSELLTAVHREYFPGDFPLGPNQLFYLPEHALVVCSHGHSFVDPVLEIIGCIFYRLSSFVDKQLIYEIDLRPGEYYWTEPLSHATNPTISRHSSYALDTMRHAAELGLTDY